MPCLASHHDAMTSFFACIVSMPRVSMQQKQRHFVTLWKLCLQAEDMIIKYVMLKDASNNDSYYAKPLVTNEK
jgi:hypothetical protein